MDTLLLDQTLWDLCKDADGNIARAADPYSVAQDVASAIRLFAGELWYNTAKGIPYFTQILGKQTPAQLIKAQFVAAAKTVPGVTDAIVTLSLRNRALSGQIVIFFATTTSIPAGGSEPVVRRTVITFVGDSGGILTFVGDNGDVLTFEGLG